MRHLFIPDCQVRPGVPTDHLEALGNYIVEKKPDVIINIGDFADMPSLSSYDAPGSKSMENRRYHDDVNATHEAMQRLLNPLYAHNKHAARNKKKKYKPRMVLTLGNHEDRITRAIEKDPVKLEGRISIDDLDYENYGWEVHQFLKPVIIDNISYCHYHKNPNSPMSAPMGGMIQTKLNNFKASFSQGHNQMFQYGVAYTGMYKRIHGLQCGSFYMHDEGFMQAQGNREHWRGIVVKNEVHDGQYDPCFVSLDFLLRNYL